jgi:hypothetical protein
MAEEKKTLEMRVAELEDKLAQLHISESDMAIYQKVAAKLGAGAPLAQPCMPAAPAPAAGCIISNPIIQHIRPIGIRPIYWADCIQQCFAGGGGGVGGGGFGSLGG